MSSEAGNTRRVVGSVTAKLLAVLFIVICVAVGAVGLILPIIPGLLFLAIAIMIIAKTFPALDRRMRRNRTLKGYLDSADGFWTLSILKKCQYGLLLCLQLFIDAAAFLIFIAARTLDFAVGKYQSLR